MTAPPPNGPPGGIPPPAAVRLGPFAAGAFSLLMVGSLYALPLLGLVIAPLGLIPVLHLEAAQASRVPVSAWVVGVLAVSAALGLSYALALLLPYMLLVAAPAASVRLWARIGGPEGRWTAATVLAAAVAVLALVAVLSLPAGPVEASRAALREMAPAMLETATAGSSTSVGSVELALDHLERWGVWVAPSLPIAYLVVVLFWIRPRLPLLGLRLPVGPFEAYRSEEWLPAAFAVAGGGTVLLGGTGRWVALNLLVAVLLLYFVHGLAIIRAHLVRYVGRGWLVRWGVALLCLVNPLPLLVAMLGVADSFYPLRPRLNDDGGQ